MSILRSVTAGLRTLFNRDAAERELDDELRHYLAMATEENVRKGMSREDAERAARVAMGGLEANKFDARGGGWEARLTSVSLDVRVAFRALRHSPAFAVVAIASLALGIGVNTTMFSVMNAVMFRPLPYHDASKLALIWTNDARRGLPREVTPYLTVTDWQQRSRAFQDIAYFTTQRVAPTSVEKGGGRTRSRTAMVSENLFPVLGVTPLHGRLISAADVREHAQVAVISYGFWQRWFDGSPKVIGKTLTMEDASSKFGVPNLTVVGVLPAGFYFPDKATEIWTPSTTYWRFQRESTERFIASARRWTAVGRLAPGASMEDAHRDLDAIGRQLAATYTTTLEDFPGFATTVVPVLDTYAGASLQSTLWTLLAAVAVVLLVVCANVANLQLARGATRQREFAVRRALGAGRARIVRQLIAESLALVLIGGAIGTTLAMWGTPLLASWAGQFLPRMDEIAIDWRVLTFAAVASFACGIVFGLVPAIRLSATDANEALREGGHGTGSVRLRRSQGALVLAECTLALVLLTGAGLLIKSLGRLHSVNPGYDARNVLTMRLEFPAQVPTPAQASTGEAQMADARGREQEMNELAARVAAVPGVEVVGFVDDMFVAGQGNDAITIRGRSADEIPAGELNYAVLTPGFFRAMRVPVLRGRTLTADDAAQRIRALWTPMPRGLTLAQGEQLAVAEPVVVNEAFVRRFFPTEDPIGRRFCTDPTNKTYWYEIVGVMGDMQRGGLERKAIPEFYGHYVPSPNGRADLVVRTQRDPLALAASLRSEVKRVMPSVVVVSVATAEEGLDGFSAQRRLQTWLLTLFAGLALMLAAVGIFGLAHYSVAERTREIGVRVALGATPRVVIRLVIARGMRMPALGIAVGLVASLALTRVISNQLFDVQPTDPLTYGAVALVLALVAAFACYLAARRAAQSDPVKALREA